MVDAGGPQMAAEWWKAWPGMSRVGRVGKELEGVGRSWKELEGFAAESLGAVMNHAGVGERAREGRTKVKRSPASVFQSH